jgi:hypothetical protein
VDGTKLVAAHGSGQAPGFGGFIYGSTNSGTSWTRLSAPSQAWQAVNSSADGAVLVAVSGSSFVGSGAIYTSSDSGLTWSTNSAPSKPWAAAASSAHGNTLCAGVAEGLIYVSRTTPTPWLNLAATGSNILLSWTVPSMNFVLQQNADLTTTNWSDAGATPNLNYTTLQYEVAVPTTPAGMFYRLVSR